MATRFLRQREDRRSVVRARIRGAPSSNAVGRTKDPYADEAIVRTARLVHSLRRRRNKLLGGELFSDTAWDLLLYLYVAGSEGDATGALDACAGTAAPQTTALRWLQRLEEAGLLVRDADPNDARRDHVRLTPTAARAMRDILEELRSGLGIGS
jgi:DNA-binding MarR family transcriptional regulator